MKRWSISGGIIMTPHEVLKKKNILVVNDKISRIAADTGNSSVNLVLENSVVMPGLINAHDHLLGTYHPKIGQGPYLNWLPWDNDLKSSPVYQERQQIENRDLYLLGAYRNLISGVTMISDHIPHFVGDPFYDLLPTKAIKRFALAHSVCSFALAWGDGIPVEYQKAAREDMPFVTHCSEGFDDETMHSIDTLNRQGALGEHSVLVHCIAFSEADRRLVKERGAHCVWCADSNMYMYNETADVKLILDAGINLSIGTDSSATGGENLLYEIRYDKALFEEIYGEELPDETIVKMVTVNPARAFRLRQSGEVKEGNIADLLVLRHKGKTPAESLTTAGLEDVELVIVDGRPAYGDAVHAWLFEELGVPYQRVTVAGTERVIVGDAMGLMRRISRAVGFKKEFSFFPIEFEV